MCCYSTARFQFTSFTTRKDSCMLKPQQWSLSIPADQAFMNAQQIACAAKATEVKPILFLFSILAHGNNLGTTMLRKMYWLPSVILAEVVKCIGINPKEAIPTETDIPLSAACRVMMDNAAEEAKKTKSVFVGTEHIFLSMLASEEKPHILTKVGITYEKGLTVVQKMCDAQNGKADLAS